MSRRQSSRAEVIRFYRVEYAIDDADGNKETFVEMTVGNSGRDPEVAKWETYAAPHLMWTDRDTAESYAAAQNNFHPSVTHTVVEVLVLRTGARA